VASIPPVAHTLPEPGLSRRWRRPLLWAALVTLILLAQVALWWLTRQHERNRVQEATDAAVASAVVDLRQRLVDDVQALQLLLWAEAEPARWQAQAGQVLRERHELVRIELRDTDFALTAQADSGFHSGAFQPIPRTAMSVDAEIACAAARRFSTATFSRSYFLPTGGGLGHEVVDLCLPRAREGRTIGTVVATLALSDLLEQALPLETRHRYEVVLVESDGTRLARSGINRGAGVFMSERLLDFAGLTLPLRLDSADGEPRLFPNLVSVMVLALSTALLAVVGLLVRDVRRRAQAEQDLAEALAFRKAMEDSLVTGLRARDLSGLIRYVNPAFCEMVGYRAEELVGTNPPPYWPPEMADEYARRQALRLSGDGPSHEGYESTFMRRDGSRFPVLVFEAPLVDGRGRQTGWMSAIVDVSAQRRVEEISRQQQDKLQAAARLATMGEMATLLSHELNQPLAAIASYAGGTLNLLPTEAAPPPPGGTADSAPGTAEADAASDLADRETQLQIRQAVTRIAEQADRAGRIIRSVHQFVRRRERLHETVRAQELIDGILPLLRLAARRSETRIDVDLGEGPLRVHCDRTMVEQVLLNLARNGLQAMEATTPAAERVLGLQVRRADARWIEFTVTDSGPGIPPEVAARLYTPFFSTKPEGMGIGLSMCRTVVEQHGGLLGHGSGPDGRGTRFRFTLADAAARTVVEAA
jgi:two-component system sensor histidine kinase DctS